MERIRQKIGRLREYLVIIDSLKDSLTVVELLQRRLTAYRRSEIARNDLGARKAVREKRAQSGNVDDLKRDLNA
jgi:hypothetical protein